MSTLEDLERRAYCVHVAINPHRECYQEIGDYLDDHGRDRVPADQEWRTLVELHVAYRNPVGFVHVSGATLAECLSKYTREHP